LNHQFPLLTSPTPPRPQLHEDTRIIMALGSKFNGADYLQVGARRGTHGLA
jgi:hypothetical protein